MFSPSLFLKETMRNAHHHQHSCVEGLATLYYIFNISSYTTQGKVLRAHAEVLPSVVEFIKLLPSAHIGPRNTLPYSFSVKYKTILGSVAGHTMAAAEVGKFKRLLPNSLSCTLLEWNKKNIGKNCEATRTLLQEPKKMTTFAFSFLLHIL